MSWAEVKKINSNLDVPLDKLIKSQRVLGASDAVMAVIVSSEVALGYNDEQTVGTFTPKVNGSVRILAEMHGAANVVGYIRVYNSAGTKILEISRTLTSDNPTQNCDTDFSVSANETYTIKTKRTGTAYLNYLKIGATVIDGSMLDYTVDI